PVPCFRERRSLGSAATDLKPSNAVADDLAAGRVVRHRRAMREGLMNAGIRRRRDDAPRTRGLGAMTARATAPWSSTRVIAAVLSLVVTTPVASGATPAQARPAVATSAVTGASSTFEEQLEAKYVDPDRAFSTD